MNKYILHAFPDYSQSLNFFESWRMKKTGESFNLTKMDVINTSRQEISFIRTITPTRMFKVLKDFVGEP